MSQPRGRSRAEKSSTASTSRATSAKAPADAQEPAAPVAAQEPAAPVARAEPAANAEPATPAETPAEPTEPAANAEPATPAETPAEPAEPAANAEPTEPAEPADADEHTTEPTEPAEPAAPADAEEPAEPVASHDRTRGDLSPAAASPGAASPGAVRRAIMIGALIVLGIAGVGGGGTLLALHLSRATNTGVSGGQAVNTRWQRLPAGQIFPATIQYVSAQNVGQFAHRVGIAPTASCLDGLDSAASAAMTDLGCTMVLRATYADQSGALLATVGVAVVASPHAAVTAAGRLAAVRPPAGVKPEPFSGTVADLFTDAQRAATGTPVAAGPYVFFYAAGYADGRPGQAAGGNPELDSLGRALVTMVEHVLTSQGTR